MTDSHVKSQEDRKCVLRGLSVLSVAEAINHAGTGLYAFARVLIFLLQS